MTALRSMDEPRPVRLTVDDYHLLDRSGAFSGYLRTELIDGVILAVNSQFSRHARAKSDLAFAIRDWLIGAGRRDLIVIIEVSVRVDRHDEPMPDIVLCAPDTLTGAIPVADVQLVVEVSDSSLSFDLGDKAVLYARGGVPEYWVVDLDGRAVHRMTGPSQAGYASVTRVVFGDALEAVTVAGLTIDTGIFA